MVSLYIHVREFVWMCVCVCVQGSGEETQKQWKHSELRPLAEEADVYILTSSMKWLHDYDIIWEGLSTTAPKTKNKRLITTNKLLIIN